MIRASSSFRVLAIDPGFDRLGIAVIERKRGKKETVLYSNCIETLRSDDFSSRLAHVARAVRTTIKKFTPTTLAIETLFFSTNQKTAMRVAEVRGAIILCAHDAGLPIHEYGPGEIKMAVTGYGKSDKKEIATMIPLLVTLTKKITRDDEYDAIAIGLTCLAHQRR